MTHEVNSEADFAKACFEIAHWLDAIDEYLGDDRNLTAFEAWWFAIVSLEYHYVIQSGDDDSGGSNYRVDDTLY
jgi:hypothetical protein